MPARIFLSIYDPRDLSRLYVLTPSKGYQAVPYADVRRPPITLAELRFAHAELRREAKGCINEERLFAMHARQQAIITDATKATKAARRRKELQQRRPAPDAGSITNPKVRGTALWTAHALLATCHSAASDRSSCATPQDRQAALLAGAPPASRQWLAQRQAEWPPEYRRSRWIDVQATVDRTAHRQLDINC